MLNFSASKHLKCLPSTQLEKQPGGSLVGDGNKVAKLEVIKQW